MTHTGYLEHFTVREHQNPTEPAAGWEITMRLDGTDHTGHTGSRIASTVLETALLRGRDERKWPILVEIKDGPVIDRVRIADDREEICKDTLETVEGLALLPLSPTAFAGDNPPMWGFFFYCQGKCKEKKGTSLDLYAIIEEAWIDGAEVMLKLDAQGFIEAATRAPLLHSKKGVASKQPTKPRRRR